MEHNKALESEFEAITMAEKTCTDIPAKLQESISPALNIYVSDISYAITDSMFERLYVDESLSITLRSARRTVPMDSMSRGNVEQIYLAFRIATTEILYPNLALPILLDDSFIADDCLKYETCMLAKMGANYGLISTGIKPVF